MTWKRLHFYKINSEQFKLQTTVFCQRRSFLLFIELGFKVFYKAFIYISIECMFEQIGNIKCVCIRVLVSSKDVNIANCSS